MLQTSESRAGARREWMGLLARAPDAMLDAWLKDLVQRSDAPVRFWMRRPESGLVMLRGRIGGTGDPFNLGEMTMTRCALRIETGEVGVAYVAGRSARKAEAAALADAMLQSEARRDDVVERLLGPVRDLLAGREAAQAGKAASTKVDFFTIARETGA